MSANAESRQLVFKGKAAILRNDAASANPA